MVPFLEAWLFLDFLMLGMRLTPPAILLELDLFGDELFIFARPIIDAIAFGTGELEKLILGHNVDNYSQRGARGQAIGMG